uniref:Uncharacterized protein n=1 Tax=Rhizophora mucronata TaxID=61149 RepID=A0A2P2Q1U8_RHIMU
MRHFQVCYIVIKASQVKVKIHKKSSDFEEKGKAMKQLKDGHSSMCLGTKEMKGCK